MYDESVILSLCDGVVFLVIRYRGGMLILYFRELLFTKLEPHLGAAVCKTIGGDIPIDTYCLCAFFLLVLFPYDGKVS